MSGRIFDLGEESNAESAVLPPPEVPDPTSPRARRPGRSPVFNVLIAVTVVVVAAASIWFSVRFGVRPLRAGDPRPSPTVDPLTAKQHLDQARDLVKKGYGKIALSELAYIGPDDPEYPEARKLRPKAEEMQRQSEKREDAEMERFTAKSRVKYAEEFEAAMLKEGHDFYVRGIGPNNTTLRIQYILISRPFVYKLMNDRTFMDRLRGFGFKKVIFTNGYGLTWDVDV